LYAARVALQQKQDEALRNTSREPGVVFKGYWSSDRTPRPAAANITIVLRRPFSRLNGRQLEATSHAVAKELLEEVG
jgi:hypothetical protein